MRADHEVSLIGMYLQVISVFILGLVVEKSSAGVNDKLHIKILVPEIVNHRHHDKYIIHPVYSSSYQSTPPAGYRQGPAKLQQLKQQPKKEQPSPGFHYGNDNPYIFEPYTGPYQQSWKTVKSEEYQTETVDNPFSNNPDNKYLVKSTYKVREKLPFEDATTGYDREYFYPLSETGNDYQKTEKVVDFNNAKTDPFPGNVHAVPVKSEVKEQKKPKELNYFYKYPSNDYEYLKNVHVVNSYLNNEEPKAPQREEKEKFDDYGYNNVDYDAPKPKKYEKYEEYHISDYDHFGPSNEESYENYKTDGPSYGFD